MIHHQAELLNGFRHFGRKVCHAAACTIGVVDQLADSLLQHLGVA
jgi:hypothetical protein